MASQPSESRWSRADSILEAALDLPTGERPALIAERCAGDRALADLVERLLVRCQEDDTELMPGGALAGSLAEGLGRELELGHDPEGQVIGRYRVLREIARGGMAVVYLAGRAEDDFHQLVALKLLQPGLESEHVVRRFHLERQILASARHPNIAQLLDAGVTDDGRPFLAMEYVDGEPIDAFCDQRRLSVSQRLWLFLDVARAVDHAHRNLVVHRDIKPSNILVTGDGNVKLLDFGIAKVLEDDGEAVTRTHMRVMTPAFASPEQIEGDPITTSTDIYQLGMLLYLLLAGRWPYPRASASDAAMLLAICREPPIRPSTAAGGRGDAEAVPGSPAVTTAEVAHRRASHPARLRRELAGDLDTIVLTALRKEPERRYASVAQLVGDVERYLEGRTISARPDTVSYRLRTFVRRHTAATATAAASLALVVGLVAFFTIELGIERNRARLEARKAGEIATFLTGLFQVSAPTRSKGEALTARELLDRGAERIDAELADQPQLQAAMMTIIGSVYGELAMFDEGRALLERAVEIRRRHPGARDLDLAASLYALGEVGERTRDLELARSSFTEALEIREAALGREHPDVARARDALGVILRHDGDLEAARALHEEAIQVLSATLGPGDAAYGLALNRLAVVLQDQRDYRGSIPLFEEAIAVLDATAGADHPYTASAKFNFANSLRHTGREEDADEVYREVLPAIEALFGPHHPAVATVLNNHSNLLRAMGRLDQAEATLQRALAIWSASLGPHHPQVGWALNNLGLVERDRGNHAAAHDYFARSVEIAEAAHGPDHADVATQLANLAGELHSLGDTQGAIPLMERAIEIRERVFGPDHSFVGEPVGELAAFQLALGRYAEAEALFRRAAELGRKEPEHRVHEITTPRIGQARCLAALGRPAEAAAVLGAEREQCAADARALVDAALAEIEAGRTTQPAH